MFPYVPGAKEDLELAVTGKLDDAKCAFGERKLDFQTVSVGMERDLAASVLNTGQCAAVCNVEVPPEVSDFLFVSHTRFRLVPGGTQHLTVSLKPRAPRTLDGTTLLCHVRGAKSVRLPVTGSAIIPDVRILAAAPAGAPPPRPKGDLFDGDYDDDDLLGDDGAGPDIPTLDFADQFVGFEERRRIVLQNESEIGAFLALDLNAFPDFYAEPCKPSDTLHKPPAAPEAAKEEPGATAKSPAAPSRSLDGDAGPPAIGDYRGVPLAWTFPIRGIVNAPLQLRAVRIAAKAKTSTRHEIVLKLSSIASLAPGGEDFDFEVVADGAVAKLVNSALEVRPVDTRLTAVDGELKFDAIFEPLRPFSTSVHLVVKRATGGRWPFEVQLDVDEPDPDDAIEIEANLHTTAKVQFKLVNSNAMDYTPFNAFFSTDSAHTLTVSPAHGLLAPVGTEGTNFDVSFRPVKYGMLQRGRLIIQTEDMMWSYEVHGTHPSFTVPVSQSKVDTHMSKKYLRDKARH